MAIRFTRKGIIAIVAVFLLLAGGTTGYIVWRINQEAQLSEEDADAGSGSGGECSSTCKCTFTYDGVTKNSCGEKNALIDQGKLSGDKCYRVNCQDYGGGWIQTKISNVADACGKCGYSDKPIDKPGDEGDCSCQSYTNSNGKKCGVNCTFPAGTQAKVDNLSENNGVAYIAMCKSGGIIQYEVFNSSHVCWGLQNECKNPVGEPPEEPEEPEEPTNVCEGGELLESAKTTFNEGETVEIKGYAFDKDGINKSAVAVTVNGVSAGNATVVDACPTGDTSVCSSVGSAKKPVVWSYSFVPTEEETTVAVTWTDTKGKGGSNCQASRTVTTEPTVDTNPDWEVVKAGAGICLNDNTDDSSFKVDYVITVTNTGDGEGEIDKVVDTLDSKVLADYVLTETFDPSATLSGSTIIWDLNGADGTFAAGQSKTYEYSIEVPNGAFGTYTNTVVVTPVVGDEISDTEIVVADCDAPPETPETGIFDSWLARVGFGFLLISAGLAYLNYMDGFNGELATSIGKFVSNFGYEGRVANSRKRFERKVVKK